MAKKKQPVKKHPVHKKKHKPTPTAPTDPTSPDPSNPDPGSPAPVATPGQPIFAQPQPSPDPTGFRNPVMDQSFAEITTLGEIPEPVDNAVEPILTLQQAYGNAGAAKIAAIEAAGQIVFHSVGDTGSVVGPETQSLVADKMVSDFTEANAADVPSFFFHLGDVVYYFGEATYYYDQFFEPFRAYPAPIFAVPGNHDGVVYATDPEPTLDAFLRNFCAPSAALSPDAGGLLRTTMIQPGVYFTLEAPFVRILGLYSNVLEDPGVISDQNGTYSEIDERQVTFLTTALERAKSEEFTGAIVITVHHPPFTGGSTHGGSPDMLADIDRACEAAGLYPHAVFSGHAHNYQRFTREINDAQCAFVVAGCGGHSPLSHMSGTHRTPFQIDDTLTLESYDDTHYGYLRVIVNATTMTIEYHPQDDQNATKTPDDSVTIDLASRTVS